MPKWSDWVGSLRDVLSETEKETLASAHRRGTAPGQSSTWSFSLYAATPDVHGQMWGDESGANKTEIKEMVV